MTLWIVEILWKGLFFSSRFAAVVTYAISVEIL